MYLSAYSRSYEGINYRYRLISEVLLRIIGPRREMNREEEGGLVVVRGRVEIDMRQPFRSVKEAVLLFGEKVLAGEVYANKLNEMKVKEKTAKYPTKPGGALTADHHQVEQTKKLSNAKDETADNLMVQCLNSLRQELEQTKMELQQLKSRKLSHVENDKQLIDPEIEELKFIENNSKTNKVEIKRQTSDVEDVDLEFERKRSVKFASPPSLTRVIVSKDDAVENGEQIASPKKKTKKKKPLVSLMGGLFVKKEGKKRK